MQRQRTARDNFVPVLLLLALLVGALLVAGDHYLLFHSLVELFSAAILLVIFSIAWHTRRFATSDYLTFVGMAAFSIAWVTVLHALTFRGVQLLPEYDANLPTQLWVIARLIQAAAFLVAPVYLTRRLARPGVALGAFTLVATLLVGAALAGRFPVAFVEGQGLTPFKIGAEYFIILATIVAAGTLIHYREHVEKPVLRFLLLSMGSMVIAEFAFTLYTDPTGPFNRLGHVAYLAAFSFLYLALVRASLEDPYYSLFRQLKHSEEQLGEAYAVEHDIAETLQNAMAANPKQVPGVQVSHLYRPAPGKGRIGGDFYDVFPVGGARIGFVIGDVCGKGLRAAGSTLKTRTALRAMALEHAEPEVVLERVNTYLCSELEDDSFVTAAYGTLDTVSGVLRLALAGHPDPLICGRDSRPFDRHRTPPLGVLPHLDASSAEVQLHPGESVVLVTDGLVDAPGHEDRFGVARLASLVSRLQCGDTADAVLAQVADALGSHAVEPIEDDVAVVVIRWEPETALAYGT